MEKSQACSQKALDTTDAYIKVMPESRFSAAFGLMLNICILYRSQISRAIFVNDDLFDPRNAVESQKDPMKYSAFILRIYIPQIEIDRNMAVFR